MIVIPEKEFVTWLKELHLLHNREWRCIDFPEKTSDWRFWTCPTHVPRLIYLVHALLIELGDWKSLTVYRQGGAWMPRKSKNPIDRIQYSWLAPFNLPSSGRFALRFLRSEIDTAVSLIVLQQMFGWCMSDDTYVIPDHGNILLHTSHHDVIDVEFRRKSDIRRFVSHMKKEDFPLPTEVPDETFDIPPWMKKKG